jgi:hypothetical protein
MNAMIAKPRHRLNLLIPCALGVALLMVSVPAVGATPKPAHANFSESYDDVVCGIPVHVEEQGQWTNTESIDNDGNYLFRGTLQRTETYSAANLKSVIARDANQLTFSDPTIDEEAGTITFVNTLRGVLEMMKLPDGRVMFVDAGDATDAITLDLESGAFISFEHVVFHGRDPNAESGFTLWCEAFVEAVS